MTEAEKYAKLSRIAVALFQSERLAVAVENTVSDLAGGGVVGENPYILLLRRAQGDVRDLTQLLLTPTEEPADAD